MKIATSYFYQIRNFKPYMIPVSTALSDPFWYKPPNGEEYYIDKRGVVNGLRYEPLIVQRQGTLGCPGEFSICSAARTRLNKNYICSTMQEYEYLLQTLVNKEQTLKAFNFCANKFKKELKFKEEPIIVLMVYETPKNRCSERYALQKYFNCEELSYPI